MPARIFITDPHRRVSGGHPWIFDSQVLRSEGDFEAGDVVEVIDVKKGPVGLGFINPKSLIRVRLLTRNMQVQVDEGFIRHRIRAAWAHRQRMGYTGSCRVVFGESDGLPALIVDKFNDADAPGECVLSIQTLALGMERWKEIIADELRALFDPRGIYERNDVAIREKEGLTQHKGPLGPDFPTQLVINENGLRMHVDIATGQKTGHFLDQVRNHAAIAPIAQDARVLDCFTHTGGFALHAAHYGAREVLGLDISEEAVALATHNAQLNNIADRCTFQAANVFDFLTNASRNNKLWDVIVLDPPAFAKSKSALENATRGYKEINLRALKCLHTGGFLVTCSCSFHMAPELFRKTIADAAADAGKQLREVYTGSQPPDHPVLWGVPETHYLKCHILQVV
ncbi:MAG: class I SAM-dependent rRNA methyltransferase [Flavobacteriales bacterium]|nr:class I SAM-dependent rRNA methyltransferase [Flavobacteriales bacterium]